MSSGGYGIDTAITDAISQCPTPTSCTDLRAFFSLANQLASSTNILASLSTPLRSLLSTKNELLSASHEQSFQIAKQTLTSTPILSSYDPFKQTHLCIDASRQGLGFIPQQMDPHTSWFTVPISDAESRYTIIELELLEITWAIIESKIFLAGMSHFTVLTDHHPLIPIFNNHCLDDIKNPQLQHLKMKIMGYNSTAEWIEGDLNNAPDALSRNPVSNPYSQELLAEGTALPAEVQAPTCYRPQHDSVRLQDLRRAAEIDEEYQMVKHHIGTGFPQKRSQLPEKCHRY